MRHHVAERKLGMKTAHRLAMLSNMASSLVLCDRIETTLTRAKELRCIADRIITLGKIGTVHARRRARMILKNSSAVSKAFGELAERFSDRHGGYTRILKLGNRHGDCAPMAIIEYLPSPKKAESTTDTKEKKGVKKAASKIKDKIFKKAEEKTPEAAEKPAKKPSTRKKAVKEEKIK